MTKSYDIIVVGGGTSGVAAAIAAAREGAEVLLLEENGFLGGAPVATYVVPMMRTILADGTNLASGLYLEACERLTKEGFCAMNFDNNPGWFVPEMMKFILDEMVEEAGVKVIFHSKVFDLKSDNRIIKSLKVADKVISEYSAEFFIDATGEARIAALAGVPFELGKDNRNQSLSHRFAVANVDIEIFAQWLDKKDPDKNVSPIFKTETGDILLTTACTAENKGWALRDIFDKALADGVIEPCDAEYFQLFTMPGHKGFVYFNCPRICAEKNLSPLDVEDISFAQIQGRKQIKRLVKFLRIYLPGFENAVISNVAYSVGIRDSRRIKGKYTLTADDIFNTRKFDNAVASCNYPVDIHSSDPEKGGLFFLPENEYYDIPLECLETKEIDNLLVAGKAISAEFEAQASLRVQPTMWNLGESAGRTAAHRLKD